MMKSVAIPDEVVMNKIHLIRGRKVMLDRDLAELYGVEKGLRNRQSGVTAKGSLRILCSR